MSAPPLGSERARRYRDLAAFIERPTDALAVVAIVQVAYEFNLVPSDEEPDGLKLIITDDTSDLVTPSAVGHLLAAAGVEVEVEAADGAVLVRLA